MHPLLRLPPRRLPGLCASLTTPSARSRSTSAHPSQPPPANPPTSPLSTTLRQTLRNLPHPIIILTTVPTPTTPSGTGITLSTFTCLSLHPHPLITFSIKTPSTTAAAMHASGRFVVHILGATPHAAHLAAGFARGRGGGEIWGELMAQAEDWEGVKMLEMGEGMVARLRCRMEKVMGVQDHEVWVGRVEEVEAGKGEALVYVDRMFKGVGGVVLPERGVRGLGVEE